MADANGISYKKMGIAALITGTALLVPLGWARLALAKTDGKLKRIARPMPGMGKRKAVAAPPVAEAEAPPAAPVADAPPTAEAPAPPTAAPTAEPTAIVKAPPVAPEPVPEPPAPPPVAPKKVPAPIVQAVDAPEKLTPLIEWFEKYAGPYKDRVRAHLGYGPGKPDPVITAMNLCKAFVEVLPGELIDKLEDDYPAIKPELALCERKAVEAPAPPTPVPTTPTEIAPQPAPPVVESPAPPVAPPVVAPVVVPTATPAEPEPAQATEKPEPVVEAPPPPAPPPVAPTVPTAVAEPSPPAPDTAQLATPLPPEGFNAAEARLLAPKLAKSVRDKKYNYDRKLAIKFQKAAGISQDRNYGGETRGAIEALGVRRPPRALFKPTDTVPYRWADHV